MVAEASRVRVLSWNVHGFVGRSGRRDVDAVAQALREIDADIAVVQEIDDRGRGPGEDSAFDRLPKLCARHAAAARTLSTAAGDYGHLLMSRWPIAAVERIDLAVGGREPRVALSVRVDIDDHPVRVVSTHLGLSARERRLQIGDLREHLERKPERAAIVLGDFNEWRRVGVATRALCPPFEIAAAHASFPARRPMLALDRVWCRSPLAPLGASVGLDQRALSDHLPVLAELGFIGG